MPGSGATPARSHASRIWRASSRCAGRSGAGGWTLTVASSGRSRRTSKSAVIVPSDVCRVRWVVIEIGTSTTARIAATISSNVRSKALPPSSRLACTCTTPAPASTARFASLAISAGVYGSLDATLRSPLPLSAATIRIGSAIGGNRIPGPGGCRAVRSSGYPDAPPREELSAAAGVARRPRQQANRDDVRAAAAHDVQLDRLAGSMGRDGAIEVAEAGDRRRADRDDHVGVAGVRLARDLDGARAY